MACVILVAAVFGTAMARSWQPAPVTQTVDVSADGWTPKPTHPPIVPKLRKRSDGWDDDTAFFAPDATCGFFSGNSDSPYACPDDQTCVIFTASVHRTGGIGCCLTDDEVCQYTVSCVGYSDNCDDACYSNDYIVKCFDTDYPYCGTVSLSSDITDFYCVDVDSSTVEEISLSYDVTEPRSLVAVYHNLSTTSTEITTTTTRSSTLSTKSVVTSSTAAPPPLHNGKPPPVGAIAGGVVGGVFALGVIAIIIWFCLRRRNRKSFTEPPQQHYQQQPQQYYQQQQQHSSMQQTPDLAQRNSQQDYSSVMSNPHINVASHNSYGSFQYDSVYAPSISAPGSKNFSTDQQQSPALVSSGYFPTHDHRPIYEAPTSPHVN